MLVSLLPLLYFFPATCGHLFIAPDDGVIQNIPFRVTIANQLHARSLPLWNPSLFSGMPLLGAAQAGVLFPLNWFYLVANPRVATNLMMLSAYMLAALGAYLCARRSGSSVAGAGLTSLVWQASAFLVAQVGHTNIVHTAALLPWLIWAVDGYGETGDRRRGLVLAVVVALQCFAGHQQTFVYCLLVATAYAIVLWRSSGRRQYLWALALVGAGLALAAVQIFPTVELLRHSLRSDASYDFFSSFSMPRRFVLAFLAPYLLGGGDGTFFRAPYVGPSFYAEYVGYVGFAALVLAFVACIFRRDARTIFWAAVVPLGILLALGRYAPLGFYKFIYAVPVLNLFRVPARHLMEVQFALAILAGRGLTALETSDCKKILRSVAIVGALLFVATCLAVSLGRPVSFRLGRNAPVSILRAPELFLPPLLLLLSIGGVWLATVRRGTATSLLLLAILYLDLNVWGQFSGWRASSPTARSELWSEPAAFRFLRDRQSAGPQPPYRIFTQDHFFDPNQPVSHAAPVEAWLLALQPDIAMMWGWDNAAGYEGFGLARYSQLAGDMKVWGDLTDPERTLRGQSRELDLLNVRYFLVRSSSAPKKKLARRTEPAAAAREVYGAQTFVKEPLNLPALTAGERLVFDVPPTETKRFALTSVLAWSAAAPDGAIVATIKLRTNDARTFEFALRAGEHTSEWAHDRSDIRAQIRHKRAFVATSYVVADADPKFEAHDYVASFELPAAAEIIGGEIAVEPVPDAPRLSLTIGRMSLLNGERVLPISKEWITLDSSRTQPPPAPVAATQSRWEHLADVGPVALFENKRVLPRAWLVHAERIATDERQLQTIRTGKVAGDIKWDPLAEALVEKATKLTFSQEKPPPEKVEVTRLEPERVSITVEALAPGLLVLADNYYPGWHAEVDGQPATIHRVNFNQRGVAVPSGKHTVNFKYEPRSIMIGFFISCLSLLLLLWWMKTQPRAARQ